jgi:L-alanine-DL-glutamate epimerase-like enolase superfamily enzyme
MIARIDVYRLKIKLREPFHVAIGVIEHASNILVRIHSSDGACGIGEGCTIWFVTGETQDIGYATAHDFARLLIGKPFESIRERMAELTAYLCANTSTKCAFDVALHDLAAKTAGVPLYAYLRGEKRTVVTDKTVGLDEPHKMAAEAKRIMQEGFPAVKVRLGTTRPDDMARVAAIRDAIGDGVPLRVDAKGGTGLPPWPW